VALLVSLVAMATAEEDCSIPETHGRWMQGALMQALRAIDAEATSGIHGETDGQVRGYTVSPLFVPGGHGGAPGRVRNHKIVIHRGDKFWFRVTGSSEQSSQLLLAMAEATRGWELGPARFEITSWRLFPGEHGWAGMIEPMDLAQAAWRDMRLQTDRIKLEFYTPVAFDSGHFPLPEWVFGNLRKRLRELVPDLAEVGLSEMDHTGTARLGAYALSTRMLRFKENNTAGFVGDCEFLLDMNLGEREVFEFHLLASYSFYCGIGRQTSWGMGQARRSPVEPFSYRGRS
jgi:CRISPR-associated endoribonuclease Cas6